MKVRVLIIGFSVTGSREGYAQLLVDRHNANPDAPFELSYCGIGGIHPAELCLMGDMLFRGRAADIVLFDVTTSGYRDVAQEAWEYAYPVITLIQQARAIGAEPVMLHLFRGGIDYSNDQFIRICDLVAQTYAVRTINLALKLQQECPGDDRVYNVDGIHPNPQTIIRYADEIEAFLGRESANVISHRREPNLFYTQAVASVEYAASFPDADIVNYERLGLDCRCVEICGGAAITLKLPNDRWIWGISYLMGPLTGRLRLSIDADRNHIVDAYDEHCYYERYAAAMVRPVACSTLRISVEHGVPLITLKKGEVNRGARIARLSAALCTSAPPEHLLAATLKDIDL